MKKKKIGNCKNCRFYSLELEGRCDREYQGVCCYNPPTVDGYRSHTTPDGFCSKYEGGRK